MGTDLTPFRLSPLATKGRSGREYVFSEKPLYFKVNLLTWLFPGLTTVVVSCAVTLVSRNSL